MRTVYFSNYRVLERYTLCLSDKYEMSGFLINKWFQRERNRNKKAIAQTGPKKLTIHKKLVTKDSTSKFVEAPFA